MTTKIPPIKIQGIKSKLVPFIKEHLPENISGVWIEPFMGSGVVGFNLAGKNAVFADVNPYIIDFYKGIQTGVISASVVKAYLLKQAPLLRQGGINFYYEVRKRFNSEHNPLDFLFLNRSCFNGLMRFNQNGLYNVPYGHKSERFAQAYITKIVNQTLFVQNKILSSNWSFLCQSFESTIAMANSNDFIYCDPPYIGRHVDYFDSWNAENEQTLCRVLRASTCPVMVSTWHHNQYRSNEFINSLWTGFNIITREHFYHVGAKETNRQPIVEALMTNYALPQHDTYVHLPERQLVLQLT